MCLQYTAKFVLTYICLFIFAVASSVTNVIAVLDAPNQYKDTHSISITCTIHPKSEVDLCEAVLISSENLTIIGILYSIICMYKGSLCIYCSFLCTLHTYSCTYVTRFATRVLYTQLQMFRNTDLKY